MEDLRQFNVDLPADLVDEVKLAAECDGRKLRRWVQAVFEDALGRTGSKRPKPVKASIPKRKRPVRASRPRPRPTTPAEGGEA